MKKIILSTALIIAGFSFVQAQVSENTQAVAPASSPAIGTKLEKKDLPEAVNTKFVSLYPGVTNANWKMGRGYNYEANFKLRNLETTGIFDQFGNLLMADTKLPLTSLPKTVAPYIIQHYAGYATKQAYKLESTGTSLYEVEVSKGTSPALTLQFDNKGNFLRELKESRRQE